MSEKQKWIMSTGGPLIIMEKSILPKWTGNSYRNANSITDYDRACSVEDYIGIINIGSDKALVLGDEPMETSWMQINESEGIIVRWNYADSEKQVEEALKSINMDNIFWENTSIEITLATDDLVLFDSSYSFEDLEELVNITITSGTKFIQSHFYQPFNDLSLLLHRITPVELTF